jgi:hypothetical protein
MGGVLLTAVQQSDYWRVKIAWPEHSPRYFGKFESEQEAQKWIKDHDWLTMQPQESQEPQI